MRKICRPFGPCNTAVVDSNRVVYFQNPAVYQLGSFEIRMAATPPARLVREDSEGKNYLIWRGPVVKAEDDDFSDHNHQTALQLVMDNFPRMMLNCTLYTINSKSEEMDFPIHNDVAWALGSILHGIVGDNGYVRNVDNHEMLEILKEHNVKRSVEGAAASSSDKESDSSDVEDHDHSSRPDNKRRKVMDKDKNGYLNIIFGNDTVKGLLKAFIEFCVFDKAASVDIIISTTNHPSSQMLGVQRYAIHESATTRARKKVKGVPDVGAFIISEDGADKKVVLYCEGKSADDEDKR